MSGLPWRLACSLACFLPAVLPAQAPSPLAWPNYPRQASQIQSASAQRAHPFLLSRIAKNQSAAELRLRGMRQRTAMPHLLSGSQPWQPLGPSQITTPQFGKVTGRVTSISIAPWDASGNTVYIGSTGGGVWKSVNAASTDPTTITWQPLTDDPAAFSGINITSLSMGAIGIQPGNATNGVVLAGTGDPNDVLDSYYGAGILRSADGGATWRLLTQSSDAFSGGLTNYSFVGDAFSGFAWSTANTDLVVAAVTDSYDGFVNDINNSGNINVAEAGLYYSTDAGQTWFLSTIEDGPNQIIQSSQTTIPSVFPGVPVTSVVWNPSRQMFLAAVQYHGYYQSADGITWIRMANQPGAALTASNCPSNPGTIGANSCAIFRGVLAVQPATGDTFALTVDASNNDQGLWQDICNAGANGCANSTVQFGVRIPDTALDDASGNGTIPQGTYNLALAAVPNSGDTLLFAGTGDVFRCSLAAGCVWRNTTNAATCASAQVAEAQHAIAALSPAAGQTLPLLYFGNDGGLWRSVDGVAETGPACSTTDAAHYQNLNGGLGSLSEVTGLASSPSDADDLLAGFGVNGTAATINMGASAWPQLLSGYGGLTAIDPANPDNLYATLAPGVAIGRCTQGANCTAADFGTPVIGSVETSGDQSLTPAPYALDSADSSNMILGTCRVWRGPATGGSSWSAANAISPMLDGHPEPNCNGNALIRSVASGGPSVQSSGTQNSGAQVLYAGMAGLLDGGGSNVSGHVFSTQTANLADSTSLWTDLALSPVSNEQSYNGVFNPNRFDVSALYVDPHDATGKTVYAAIQGFGVPHLYMSTDGGASWINISKNLPDLPLNDVLVDPNDASVVYAASDGGVFVTQNVANCTTSGGQCWSILGTGLPLAPAVKLSATSASGGLLRVGTYGRGVWQVPLLSGVAQTTAAVGPASLSFAGQPVQTSSSPQSVTVTNTGTAPLVITSISTTGDFSETDNCVGTILPGGTCTIQVTFTPSGSGTRTGTMDVSGNFPGGQQSVPLAGTGTTAVALTLLPGSISYGGQQINTTSAAQQITISNPGTSSVALTSESVSGPFSIQTNTCTATLDSNTGCTLAVVFHPVQTGPATGVVTVVSANGTETAGLTGTGENAATDTLQPSALVFPRTAENTASAPQTVTLTNSGGAPLTGIQVQSSGDFTVLDGCGISLNPQSSCTLTVQFTPHSTGLETGALTVVDSLRTQTVSLSGTSISPATDTLSSASLVFPPTPVGQSAPTQTITLTNSGSTALTGLKIQAAGAGFSATSTCGTTLAADSSCGITVTFRPTATGAAAGQLDVADALRTQIVSLSGTGEVPGVDDLSPPDLNFGGQTVGTVSPAQTVTLSNNGQVTFTGIRIQSANPDFQFTTTCATTLPPGSDCAIQVVFAPHTTGADAGVLTVDDDTRSQQVQLTGTGILANVALSPASLSFGATGVQMSTAPQTILLSNGSTMQLSGIAVSVSGAFHQTTTCAGTLAPGSTCPINVVFAPTASGAAQGSLTVTTSNAGTLSAPLTGNGISFDLMPISSTSASVTAGTAATYSLSLVPGSGSSGSATLSCANLPPNANCSIAPSTASLLSSSNIQVVVATGAAATASTSTPVTPLGKSALPFACILLIAPFFFFRKRRLMTNVLSILLVAAAVSGFSACGKGAGPLGPGAPNPLPGNSSTPPGTYIFTVSATAGGLVKTVSLTIQVN